MILSVRRLIIALWITLASLLPHSSLFLRFGVEAGKAKTTAIVATTAVGGGTILVLARGGYLARFIELIPGFRVRGDHPGFPEPGKDLPSRPAPTPPSGSPTYPPGTPTWEEEIRAAAWRSVWTDKISKALETQSILLYDHTGKEIDEASGLLVSASSDFRERCRQIFKEVLDRVPPSNLESEQALRDTVSKELQKLDLNFNANTGMLGLNFETQFRSTKIRLKGRVNIYAVLAGAAAIGGSEVVEKGSSGQQTEKEGSRDTISDGQDNYDRPQR